MDVVSVVALAALAPLVWAAFSWNQGHEAERLKLRHDVKEALAQADRAERSAAAVRIVGLAHSTADSSGGEESGPTDAGRDDRKARVAPPSGLISPEQELEQSEASITHMDGVIGSEPRDTAWSSDVETSLANMYVDRKFPKSHVDRIECRKTLCRMQARHDDPAAYEDWLQRFPAHEKGLLQRITLRKVQSDGSVHTTTVMAREGHSIPEIPR